jgi:ankyrin repeat protein
MAPGHSHVQDEAPDETDVSLKDAINGFLCGKSPLAAVESALQETSDVDVWVGKQPALCRAVWARHLNLSKLLLSYGANPDVRDDKGVSALHMAVFDGRADFIALLLEHHADPNVKDRHGQTPIFLRLVERHVKG